MNAALDDSATRTVVDPRQYLPSKCAEAATMPSTVLGDFRVADAEEVNRIALAALA